MLKIDLGLLISFILSFFVLFIFIACFLQNKTKQARHNILNDSKYLQQCPYCTYVFSIYKKTTVYQCPQCKSYIGENH